jgi:3-hydroxyisobutyrate dehydrogenase-like beta-hydroxyacid dehydrogenase
LAPGSLIIDQTSGTPAESGAIAKELQDRAIDFIDAPVSGSPSLFMDGRGTIMVSGPDVLRKRAASVLAQISDKVMPCGQRVGDAEL